MAMRKKKTVHKIAPQLFGLRQAKREACGFCKFHRLPRGRAPFLRCQPAADGFRSYGDRLLPRSPCRGSGAFLSDEAVRA